MTFTLGSPSPVLKTTSTKNCSRIIGRHWELRLKSRVLSGPGLPSRRCRQARCPVLAVREYWSIGPFSRRG